MARRSRPQSAVSAFVQSFMAGYKLFNDVDRRRTKSEEDGLSKYDSRLGERNPLSKLFGDSSDGLSGPDRGRAVLDAKIKQAYEKGDSAAVESLEKSRRLFEEQSKAYPFDDGNKIVDDKVSANESALPLERPTDVASNDTAESALPVESSTVASAMPEGGADYGTDFGNDYSLFSARGGLVPKMHAALGGSAVRMDGGTGMMPAQAAPSALPIDDNNEEPVQEASNLEAPSEETGNLGLSRDPQELADQAAPAVQAGVERISAALSSNSALPGQDPEYQAKLEAFARGEGRLTDEEVKEIDSVIDPDGSLPDSIRSTARIAALYKFYEDRGDPETASTLAARTIMRNKFESQALGSLAKSAFEGGEMESGVKLLTDAYNKNMPDGRSMLASVQPDGSVAFKIGWDKLSGFETEQEGRADRSQLIQLASNTATGSEQMQRFMALANASKEAKAKEAKGVGTKSSGAKTSGTKSSGGRTNSNSIAGDGGGGEGTGVGGIDEAGLKSAALEYRKASAAMRALPEDATIEQHEAAYAVANSAYQDALDKVPGAKLSTKVYNAIGMGIKPPELPSAVTSGGKSAGAKSAGAKSGGAGTKEEREAAKAEAALSANLGTERAIQGAVDAGTVPGITGRLTPVSNVLSPGQRPPSEGTRIEQARRVLEPAVRGVQADRATLAYEALPNAPGTKDQSLDELAEPLIAKFEALGNQGKKNKNGDIDPAYSRKLKADERREIYDILGRLKLKNGKSSDDTLVRAVYDMAFKVTDSNEVNKPITVSRDGVVTYGGKKIMMDGESLLALSMMRNREQTAAERSRLESDPGVKQMKAIERLERANAGRTQRSNAPQSLQKRNTLQIEEFNRQRRELGIPVLGAN